MSGWGLGVLLASLEARARVTARQRRRQAGRYALEYGEAVARGWVETAVRIRAEWQEWAAREGADSQ